MLKNQKLKKRKVKQEEQLEQTVNSTKQAIPLARDRILNTVLTYSVSPATRAVNLILKNIDVNGVPPMLLRNAVIRYQNLEWLNDLIKASHDVAPQDFVQHSDNSQSDSVSDDVEVTIL